MIAVANSVVQWLMVGLTFGIAAAMTVFGRVQGRSQWRSANRLSVNAARRRRPRRSTRSPARRRRSGGRVIAVVVALVIAGTGLAVGPSKSSADVTLGRNFEFSSAESIAGRITDTAGAPIEGARISAYPIPPDGRQSHSGLSSANGDYMIAGMEYGDYQVYVSKPGYVGRNYGQVGDGPSYSRVTIIAGSALTGLDVSLDRAATISGRIGGGIDPLVNARVYLRKLPFGFSKVATLDEFGDYRFGELPPGDYAVFAIADGYVLTFPSGASHPSSGDAISLLEGAAEVASIGLNQPRSMQVTVVGPSGSPVAGAEVRIDSTSDFPSVAYGFGGLYLSATTDANGVAMLNGIAPGEFTMKTTDRSPGSALVAEWFNDAYQVGDATPIAVPASGAVSPLTVELLAGGSALGRVVDSSGAPQAGVEVALTPYDPRYSLAARTDANGNYVINGVLPGTYGTVVFGFDDFLTTYGPATTDQLQAQTFTVTSGGSVTGRDVTLVRGARLTTVVLDGQGQPASGGFELLTLCPQGSADDGEFGCGVGNSTDKTAAGTWITRGIEADTYTVTYTDLVGGTSATGTISLGRGDVGNCTLRIGGTATCSAGNSPTITSITALSTGRLSVAFTPSTATGGATVRSFQASCRDLTTDAVTVSPRGLTSPRIVTGLALGHRYSCTVAARTTVVGSASAPVEATVPGAPDAPAAVSLALTGTKSQMKVTVTAPASNGGGDIASYEVTCRTGTATPVKKTVAVALGSSPSSVEALYGGLVSGSSYACTARAKNVSAWSASAAAASSLTIPTKPGTPVVIATPTGAGAASLTISGPDGGSPATSFRVICTSSNRGVRTVTTSVTNPAIVTGLTVAKSYTCTATATNLYGAGPVSLASNSFIVTA